MKKENLILGVKISLSLISSTYILYGFYNLVVPENLPVDLALRYWQSIQLIFETKNVYLDSAHVMYPPSFFLYLSPFFKITTYSNTDLVWFFLNISGLGIITIYLYKTSSEWNSSNSIILPLSFLSFHSIAHGLGIGQVHVLILASLILYLWVRSTSINSKLLNSIAFLALSFSLGKFSLLIPFAIYFLLAKKHRMWILSSILFNVVLSFIVLKRVGSSILEYIFAIIGNSGELQNLGSIDLQSVVGILELPSYTAFIFMILSITLMIFLIVNYRLSEINALALAAVTARFFMYHGHYDNVILIFLLIPLFKNSFTYPSFKSYSISLFATLSLIIPARFLEWNDATLGIFLIFQIVVWIFSISYLIIQQLKIDEKEFNHSYTSL